MSPERSFALPVALMFAGVVLLILAAAGAIGGPGAALEPETYPQTAATLRPFLAAASALVGITCLVFGVRALRNSR